MSSNLYEQAIADAKQLREIAEQNAKNAIIESITPQIRELIESQILGEDLEDDNSIIEDSMPKTDNDASQEFDLTPESVEELKHLLEEKQDIDNDSSNEIDDSNISEAETKESKILFTANKVKECNEYIDALNEMLGNIRTINPASLDEKELQKYIALVAISDKAVNKLTEEMETTDSMDIFEHAIKSSQDQITDFKKEIKEMKRSLKDLLSEEVITIELDLGDVDAPEDVEVRLPEVEEEAEEGDEELSDEESDDLEVSDEEEVEEEELEEEEELDLDALVMELDEEEAEDVLEEEEDLEAVAALDEEEEEDMMESLSDDTVLEIDENMLREELANLMNTSEDTETNINEETDTTMPVADEQNDALREKLDKYEEAVTELKAQLAEMNLFNAKLLYTNKLLMNSELNQGQRAQAIETLDDAASLREVKLLFKTLTESFSRRAEDKTSSRNIGGASRPTKSASMNLNESKEAGRWALLAGIK